MQGDEIRALRRLQREQGLSSHVFMTERDGPMTPKAFHALFGRMGARAADQYLFLIGNLLNADTRSKPTQRFIGTQKRFSMMKRRRKYGPT
jgi:hypothetical protein